MADADRTSYAYGDSTLAGDRLALLASIFEATTAAFLRAAAMAPQRWPEIDPVTRRRLGPGIDVAIDLGCGPGFTSRLIGDVVAPDRVVGFDFSAAFVKQAKTATAELVAEQVGIGRAPVMYAFVTQDVTHPPFPVPPAPLVFARYLAAHLTDPAAAIAAWSTLLTRDPAGRLLLEEIVSIETNLPVLSTYVDTVTALSAHHGTDLVIGRRLGDLVPSGLEIVHDERVTIAPDARVVARMFAMNLTVWRDDPFAQEHLTRPFIDDLERSLRLLAGAASIPPAGTGPEVATGSRAGAGSEGAPADDPATASAALEPLLAAAAELRAEAAGGAPVLPSAAPPPPAQPSGGAPAGGAVGGPGSITWTHRQVALAPRAT